MTERVKLITDHLSGDYGVTELGRRYGVSRKTVYKWLGRHEEGGWEGLQDQSRAPEHQAGAIGAEVEQRILELKARWPDWGAPKLRHKLRQGWGEENCPAESTVSAVLKRHGLVKAKRRRPKAVSGGGGPLANCLGANQVWCIDFKGWWRTKDGKRCDPLTVSDAWSRYLLRCVGLGEGTSGLLVRPHLELLFREYGLPLAMRSDNGAPFASTGLGGLTEMSVWWLRLGIQLERITPGCPQENGRHERMHLTLETSRAREPRAHLELQQAAFGEFRTEFNDERPHEALDWRVPSDLYEASPRAYAGQLPPPRDYPEGWEVRQVRGGGQMKWRSRDVAVTHALTGERIGLEPRADGVWAVWFEAIELGLFDERTGRITGRAKLPQPPQEEPAL